MNYKLNSNINILVIGDIMLDHYIYGDCNRISPEAPVQVVEIKNEEFTLGGAGNVLKNLKAFDVNSTIITIVGADADASRVSALLNDAGFSSDALVTDVHRCTTTKSRVLASNHQLIRLDREDVQPIDKDMEKAVLDYVNKKINSADLILISDYDKGLLTNTLLSQIFELCQREGKKTLVDPKGNDFSKYRGATLIKPNKKEASLATGVVIKDKESLKNACAKIQQITGCESVVVTLSEDGIAMYSNYELQVIPTKALSVIDVTGAGDTVLASLGVAIASGNSLKSACDFANHAAAIVVSKVGSAVATLKEINQSIINL